MDGPLVSEGRVEGVSGRPRPGAPPVKVRGRLTIGADGRRSAPGPGRPRPGLRDGAGPDLLVLLLLERVPASGLEMHVLPQRR